MGLLFSAYYRPHTGGSLLTAHQSSTLFNTKKLACPYLLQRANRVPDSEAIHALRPDPTLWLVPEKQYAR
jgi:hypothetical protein